MATDLRIKESLPELTRRIVETYEECGGIHHLHHTPLPSYREIVEILKDFREIIYPGFGRRQNLHMGNVGYHVGDLIDSLYERLTRQVALANRHDCNAAIDLEKDFEAEAQLVAIRLLESLPDLRSTLADDAPGGLRRRPRRAESQRDPLLLPGHGGHHRLPDRPRALQARRPPDPPDDDRVRPRKDGDRHPPGRHDRPPVLHRPRHRRRHRRDDRDRRGREGLPGRDPRRPQLPPATRPPARSSAAPSGTRRSRTRSSSTPTPRSSAARPSSAITPSSAPPPGSPDRSPPTPSS